MVEKPKPKKLIYKTYLKAIRNSIKSKIFRNFYIVQDGKEFDAMNNGELSCAFYVSGILKMFSLIENIHGTVKSTVEDMEKSGWEKIKKPKIGSVIVWEKLMFDDGEHNHMGFYIGNGRAISNNLKKGYPVRHDWLFEGKRKVESIYWKKFNT